MILARIMWRLINLALNLVGQLGSSFALSTFGVLLLIRDRSVWAGGCCLGLIALQWCLTLVYMSVSDLMHLRAARRGFLRTRTDYKFRMLPADLPLVQEGMYKPGGRDRMTIVKKALDAFHGKRLDPLIIYQGRSTGGGDLFPACASYPGINVSSIVLIFDDPARTPVARFRFFHELAHVGWLAPSSASYRLSMDPFLLLFVLVIVSTGLPVVLACLWVLVRVLSVRCGFAELEEELVADRVALHQLAKTMPAEVDRVVGMLERGSKAAIRFSGYRAGLAYVRARAARRYAKRVHLAPPPVIRPRRFEGWFGLGALYASVFLEGSVPAVGWLSLVAVATAIAVALGVYHLLLGFVLGSGDRLIYDKNIGVIDF